MLEFARNSGNYLVMFIQRNTRKKKWFLLIKNKKFSMALSSSIILTHAQNILPFLLRNPELEKNDHLHQTYKYMLKDIFLIWNWLYIKVNKIEVRRIYESSFSIVHGGLSKMRPNYIFFTSTVNWWRLKKKRNQLVLESERIFHVR